MKDKERIGQYKEEFRDYLSDPYILKVVSSTPIVGKIEQPTIRLQAAQRLGTLCEAVQVACAGRYRQALDLVVFSQVNIEELIYELMRPPYNLNSRGLESNIKKMIINFMKINAGAHLDTGETALPPNMQEQGRTTSSSKRLGSDHEN